MNLEEDYTEDKQGGFFINKFKEALSSRNGHEDFMEVVMGIKSEHDDVACQALKAYSDFHDDKNIYGKRRNS